MNVINFSVRLMKINDVKMHMLLYDATAFLNVLSLFHSTLINKCTTPALDTKMHWESNVSNYT